MDKAFRQKETAFDMEAASEIVDSFALSCGVNCKLLSADGTLLHEKNLNGSVCAFCQKLL